MIETTAARQALKGPTGLRVGAGLLGHTTQEYSVAEVVDLAQHCEQLGFEDFWVAERGIFALGLDGQKRKIDSLTSNIGHLLWSGIVDDDKARACAEHLMSDALFSGWGVRTMASTEGGYNPIGYHVGTVWPHDNSIIAWGLRRYGFRQEAAAQQLRVVGVRDYRKKIERHS